MTVSWFFPLAHRFSLGSALLATALAFWGRGVGCPARVWSGSGQARAGVLNRLTPGREGIGGLEQVVSLRLFWLSHFNVLSPRRLSQHSGPVHATGLGQHGGIGDLLLTQTSGAAVDRSSRQRAPDFFVCSAQSQKRVFFGVGPGQSRLVCSGPGQPRLVCSGQGQPREMVAGQCLPHAGRHGDGNGFHIGMMRRGRCAVMRQAPAFLTQPAPGGAPC